MKYVYIRHKLTNRKYKCIRYDHSSFICVDRRYKRPFRIFQWQIDKGELELL